MQYDVCLAHKLSAPGPVLVTLDDEGAARRLVKALNDEAPHFFQGEGLMAFQREVQRGPPDPEPEPDYYDLNGDDVEAMVRTSDDVEELVSVRNIEEAHPRFPGGRKGVLKAIEERLNVLHDDDEPEEDGE